MPDSRPVAEPSMARTSKATPPVARRPPGRWTEPLVDLVVAMFSTAAAVVLHLETVRVRGGSGLTPAAAMAAVHGAAVLFRRHHSWPVLLVQIATAALYVLSGFPAFMLGPAVLFAVYSAGAELGRSSPVALGSVEVAVALLLFLGPSFPGAGSVLFYLAIIAVAWWLGYLVRRWRTAAEEHLLRADELAATREELANYAVAEERRRIARELHDAVAHSMTVVAMHAGTGRMVGANDPAAAVESLAMIERLSREALSEMRRLVGLLRDDADPGIGLAPAPGLSDLHGLIAEMVAAGMIVDVHIDGKLEEVPAGPALAGFRVIQEALTNAAKHSPESKVRLRVVAGESDLSIVVDNDSNPDGPAALDTAGTGMGMIGMRERVQVYEGSLTAGPVPGGGFRVAVRIPLAGGLAQGRDGA